MSHFSDLKAEFKNDPNISTYLRSLNLNDSDEVEFTTIIGDDPNDGQVSFRIDHEGETYYLFITKNNEIQLLDDVQLKVGPGIHAQNISAWARKIENGGSPRLPEHLQKSEDRSNSDTIKNMERAGMLPPVGVFKRTFLRELAELPVGNPARSFMIDTFRRFAEIISNPKEYLQYLTKDEYKEVKDLRKDLRSDKEFFDHAEAYYNHAIERVYGEFDKIINGMKSVKAYYNVGATIWKNFPNIHDKKEIKMLYPAAGKNVGALATAMSLIDNGANNVSAIFTEIDETSPNKALGVLKDWARSNPDLKFVKESTPYSGIHGGKRTDFILSYKGHQIKLTYALKDSSGKFYFAKEDLMLADVVVIHDPFTDMNEPDAIFLWQILFNISTSTAPKAILVNDSFDRVLNPRSKEWNNYFDSVLPVQAFRVEGNFGCGASYPIYNQTLGNRLEHKYGESIKSYYGISEAGIPLSGSALVLSTANPIFAAMRTREDVNYLLDLSALAGGLETVIAGEPGTLSKKDDRYYDHSVGKMASKGFSAVKLLNWANSKADELTGKTKDLFLLVTIRFIAMYAMYAKERQQMAVDVVPKELLQKIPEVLSQYNIPSADNLPKLDAAIRKLQDL